VRVFAYNKFGFSADPQPTIPALETPCTFAKPPAFVTVAPRSGGGGGGGASLELRFPPSSDDGGCPVTKYKVEWDPAGALGFSAGAAPAKSLLYGASEVQVLTVKAARNDLKGVFRVALDDTFASQPIAAGAPASVVAKELNALATVGGVRVTRSEITSAAEGYGFAYTVTFTGSGGAKRWVGDVAPLRVSTNHSDYPSEFTATAAGGSLMGSSPSVGAVTAVDGARGFEQQQVRLFASSGGLRGTFRVGWRGASSAPLAWNASGAAVAEALKAAGAGAVRVARELDNNAMGAPASLVNMQERLRVSDGLGAWDGEDVGIRFVVVFEAATAAGTLPLLTVDGGGLRSTNYSAHVVANVSTLVQSETPTLDSALKGQAILGVTSGSAGGLGVDVSAVGGLRALPYDARLDDLGTTTDGASALGGGGGSVTEAAEVDAASGQVVKVIEGLAAGEAYHVRVSAFNGFGNGYGAATYATPAPKFGLENYGVR